VREKVERMTVRRLLLVSLALLLGASSCTSEPPSDGGLDTLFAAQLASSWHYSGAPQRVQVGIAASDANGIRYVTQGTIDVAFAYLGTDGSGAPEAGPTATADYVPVPGTDASGDTPTIISGARGVYEAEGVTFDRVGIWRATLTPEIDGVARRLTVDIPVTELSDVHIPAPGEPALHTETLTIDTKVRRGAIDSMADGSGEIPDPELHEWSIAEAIDQGRPALVLFGTPAYCESQFCGPEVTELQRLATTYPDRAVYIHVEIWKNFNAQPQVVNEGAADWLLRELPDGTPEMTEPWLYLIGADGIIVDRWGSLFDLADVAAALEALPPMDS
jgi:hypothetical protein